MADLKQHLPSLYNNILEANVLVDTENSLFSELEAEIKKVKDDQYVVTATLEGIEAYEKMLKIVPNPLTQSIEFRRTRIINRLSMIPPFSFKFLCQRLDEIIGVNKWEASVDYSNYTLYIESSAADQLWFHEIFVTVSKLKPANIVFINKPKSVHNIAAGEQIDLTVIDFNYRLGTKWILGLKPFKSLEDKGVIKMAGVSSVQPEMLNSIATFTVNDIDRVRLNGDFVISTFNTKTSSDNIITIEYELSIDNNITEVSKIELLDSDGNILTESIVYIPVLDTIILKHTISITEGE